MVLFVDETENDEYFIVTGLLVKSREEAATAYSHFKKSVRQIPIPEKKRATIFTEFKSVLLDRDFKRIKVKMLEEINSIEHCVIYSCHIKKGEFFSQEYKEGTYLVLLSKIVSSIGDDISIIFDTFNKNDFEERIIDRISSYKNVQAIMPRDSQKEPGLQFVDNLCSVIRLYKSDSDEYGFYDIIRKYVKEV